MGSTFQVTLESNSPVCPGGVVGQHIDRWDIHTQSTHPRHPPTHTYTRYRQQGSSTSTYNYNYLESLQGFSECVHCLHIEVVSRLVHYGSAWKYISKGGEKKPLHCSYWTGAQVFTKPHLFLPNKETTPTNSFACEIPVRGSFIQVLIFALTALPLKNAICTSRTFPAIQCNNYYNYTTIARLKVNTERDNFMAEREEGKRMLIK